MKNYLRYITIILVAFVMLIGINVKADDTLYSYGSDIMIEVPIHKTDINKNPLKGVEFTLKDFNNIISYSSSDEGDGDYLIEVIDSYETPSIDVREDVDQEYRIIDETGNDEVLTKILDIIPAKYSDVFRKAETEEDFFDILDLPLYVEYEYYNYYSVGFYVPLKVEETKIPDGYKAKNIVIPAFVHIYFENGGIYARLSFTPGDSYHFQHEMIPAYFEYKDGTDYEAIFDEINSNISDIENEEELLKVFEDNGAIIVDDCDIEWWMPSREDLEARFDPEIEDNFCVINLVNEKEEIPIVNPETAGVIGIIVLLIVIAFVTKVTAKKIRDK